MVKNNHTDVIFVLCDILLLLPNKCQEGWGALAEWLPCSRFSVRYFGKILSHGRHDQWCVLYNNSRVPQRLNSGSVERWNENEGGSLIMRKGPSKNTLKQINMSIYGTGQWFHEKQPYYLYFKRTPPDNLTVYSKVKLRIYALKVGLYNRNSKFITWWQAYTLYTDLPDLIVTVCSSSSIVPGRKHFSFFLLLLQAPQEGKKYQGSFSFFMARTKTYKGQTIVWFWSFSVVSYNTASWTAYWGTKAQSEGGSW